MIEQSGKSSRILITALIGLALLAGCSRKVTTSAGDQSLREKQGASGPVGSAGASSSREGSRITEQVIASPVSPPVTQERSSQPSIPSPAAASALAAETMGDVYFDYDKFTLRREAMTTLEANARWLKSQNGVKVLIEGHCDERGTQAYNLVLGERRAQSVKRYLQDLGIRSSQLQIVSFGKERPFCTEHREACWQQNRRGHFVVK